MTERRYVLELAYRGTAYSGWQRQPNALSVEETIDSALSTILGVPIKLVGCGRTDAGVHASDYVAHFDYAGTLPPRLLPRLNRYLPEDIALYQLAEADDRFHARFSATGRSYEYRISPRKDPFRVDTVTWLPAFGSLDRDAMQAAAGLLLDYGEFAPFCKTNSDAFTMKCTMTESEWDFGAAELRYRVSANRFLRGMVRLIVGTCLQVGTDKLSLDRLKEVMDRQERLPRPLSAPAEGLFLTEVRYPGRTDWPTVS
ncbi:tRNA pseudouridine38-40 synthase [Neolewinella xylanilytica]|uniref:tRNA pseudouridine synthase A n=1 Tax=Neolewinella xylanilytica TaxID=1514080 RepID=A0A2S6I2X2_9BACT|nr:tRNA pseudouridine(38-40) synthase TruA [Neolewinella xylanilytica]PPK85534.1 tRNA pseudouridine38-40 synthase [Neolewinella xylanilytica]